MSVVQKLIYSVCQPVYNRVLRDRLPREYAVVQGDIVTRHRRLFDFTRYHDTYEQTESDALRQLIRPGDQVVILGGGFGVTTVVASRAAGPDGRVISYEASPEMAEICEETVRINHTVAPVDIRRAAVGHVTDESRGRFGVPEEVVSPEELPDADVLSLDVEGAELAILQAIELPEQIVCEVHPHAVDETAVLELMPEPLTVREKESDEGDDSPFIAISGGAD